MATHKHQWRLMKGVNPRNKRIFFECAHGGHYLGFHREALRNRLKK